ncbi:MAG: hypothetical protein GX096_02025 [Clostridiales bacterium]|nr:hypothetical protein [Clostridiales bacterium]
MKNFTVKKMISLLLTLCLTLGLGASVLAEGATQQSTSQSTADFEMLYPLMDLVTSASMYSVNEPETVPGAEGTLAVSFTDAFFKVAKKTESKIEVTDAMLTDTNAQAALLSQIFAAQMPQLETVIMTDDINNYIGFYPVMVNTMDDKTIQIVGEIYMASQPLNMLPESEFGNVQWLDRGVFKFQDDSTALNGFRLTGFVVGTELDAEDAIQNYFEEIVVEYVNANLGFTILYPAIFTDEMLVEDEDGVSAVLPDNSVSFFAKRIDNTNSASLQDYVSVIANGIAGSSSSINEELKCGTVSYTTDDGYSVFDIYILTDKYIFQAELRYQTTLATEYSMYDAYLENSFVADDVSVG